MYPAEWLPDYYAALFEMKLALAGKPEKKDDLLADAQERIATLKRIQAPMLRKFILYPVIITM